MVSRTIWFSDGGHLRYRGVVDGGLSAQLRAGVELRGCLLVVIVCGPIDIVEIVEELAYGDPDAFVELMGRDVVQIKVIRRGLQLLHSFLGLGLSDILNVLEQHSNLLLVARRVHVKHHFANLPVIER